MAEAARYRREPFIGNREFELKKQAYAQFAAGVAAGPPSFAAPADSDAVPNAGHGYFPDWDPPPPT